MSLVARPVDPRDVTVEESEPTYRAYFWDGQGHYCREFSLTGVDAVEDAIGWCDEHVAVGETYMLGVLWSNATGTPRPGRRSVAFIRLKGDPPPGQSVGGRIT